MRSRRIENNYAHAIEPTHSRRDQKGRISFFDPSNQTMLDRLILESETLGDVEGDEENAQATLASVEEMIEGYEWASDDVIGRKATKGAVDMIEARLVDELTALEKVSSLNNFFVVYHLTAVFRQTSIRFWNSTIVLELSRNISIMLCPNWTTLRASFRHTKSISVYVQFLPLSWLSLIFSAGS